MEIIDVRTNEEFCKGHICGAFNTDTPIPPLTVNDYIILKNTLYSKYLNSNKKFLVYCKKGNRSNIATKILRDMGKQVIDVGGFNDYIVNKNVKICYC